MSVFFTFNCLNGLKFKIYTEFYKTLFNCFQFNCIINQVIDGIRTELIIRSFNNYLRCRLSVDDSMRRVRELG